MFEYENFPNGDKKYNIIYLDPPWSYNDKASAGKRGAIYKYPTQSIEWIENLPISRIAANDCALFMWVTIPKLNEIFHLFPLWGFEYKTCAFTWIKTNKRQTNTLFTGMGRWTRSNSELCLLATKGKPQRIDASVHSVVMSPIEEHSKKPQIVRERIVQLLGDLPRIELFARKQVNGWDNWGNEI
jgi:N6-adenosine-specific RNA methylase IME4